MATDVDLQKQAEDFLNGLAPRPVPPSSRRKKAEVIATTESENTPVSAPPTKNNEENEEEPIVNELHKFSDAFSKQERVHAEILLSQSQLFRHSEQMQCVPFKKTSQGTDADCATHTRRSVILLTPQ